MQPVLTLEDAAAFLRLAEETVQRQAALGEIPGRQIDGAWRFLLSALEDWLRDSGSAVRPPEPSWSPRRRRFIGRAPFRGKVWRNRCTFY
jgi:hypothetical protein